MNITAIIPVYNAAGFIEKAVLSTLQFDEVKEVLLIDDGSTDNSWNECLQMQQKHNRVKAIQHPDKKNHGVSASRNLGIDLAFYEFIAFLDADDYWLPNRFDAEKEYFKNPEIEGVFGGISIKFLSDSARKEYLEKFFHDDLTTVYYPAEGLSVFYGLIELHKNFGTFFSTIALTVRKSSLDKYNLRFAETMRVHEDKDFIIKLSYLCHLKTGIIDNPVAERTSHDNNTITKVTNNSLDFFKKQHVLHKSLYFWAKKQKHMLPAALQHLKLKYLYFRIAATSGSIKYFIYLRLALMNPQLLKTRYRYFALKQNK